MLNTIARSSLKFNKIGEVRHFATILQETPTRKVIRTGAYVMEYDLTRRSPAWVLEVLTAQQLRVTDKKGRDVYQICPQLSEDKQPKKSDFKGSGYAKGHLAAAANHRDHREHYEDTYLLINTVPQHPMVNTGVWNQIEQKVRRIGLEHERTVVYTGPLFVPSETKEGRREMRYSLIGESEIPVPTHFFKVIETYHEGKRGVACAWIVPNEVEELGVDDYQTTAERVEAIAKMRIFNAR